MVYNTLIGNEANIIDLNNAPLCYFDKVKQKQCKKIQYQIWLISGANILVHYWLATLTWS